MMTRARLIFALLVCALAPACTTTGPKSETHLEALPSDNPMRSDPLLLDILHYAFLWHYDQSVDLTDRTKDTLEIFYRPVPRELDEGDRSQFAELWIPEAEMLIELKRADYRIEELNVHVQDDQFKVRRVVRETAPPAPLSEYYRRSIARKRVRDWFADHLRRSEPLSDQLTARLQRAVIKFYSHSEQEAPEAHVLYVAPISPVSDELWVLQENPRQLFRFTSDMDLSDEAYWTTTPIHLKVFDLDPEIILTPADVAAGTVKLRKDFVGRALFNCIVPGQRIEISPATVQSVPRSVALYSAAGIEISPATVQSVLMQPPR